MREREREQFYFMSSSQPRHKINLWNEVLERAMQYAWRLVSHGQSNKRCWTWNANLSNCYSISFLQIAFLKRWNEIEHNMIAYEMDMALLHSFPFTLPQCTLLIILLLLLSPPPFTRFISSVKQCSPSKE